MKWVKTLIIPDNLLLEQRLNSIVRYIFRTYIPVECIISDLDATGKLGNETSQKTDTREKVTHSEQDVTTLCNEDGQIFEMDLYITSRNNFRLIVRRGDIVDVLGDADLPDEIIGPHTDGDLSAYRLDVED